LKRIINIYRLVRTLAEYKQEQVILRKPAATIRWLIMCSQWPYATRAMLCCFDEMLEDREEGTLDEFPADDPLMHLLERAKPHLVREKQRVLDDDIDALVQLLKHQDGRVAWEELAVIRRYTVNFNPAIDFEFRPEATKPKRPPKRISRSISRRRLMHRRTDSRKTGNGPSTQDS
jgi:hypothetical protein